MNYYMNLLFGILIDILKILGNVLYAIYEGIITVPIYILLLGDEEGMLECKSIVINNINDFFINIGVNISWKTIEIFDAIKKFYNKAMIPYFHNITNDYFRNSILLINDGVITTHIKNIESLVKMDISKLSYNMIFYTDYSLNDSKKNFTIILDDINNVNKSIELMNYKSNVNFIIFQLSIDDDKYDINLKEPFNYIIKNNTLKESFFKWYMKTVYNIELSSDFSVYYMLQDMSIGKLNSPFFIKFNESSVTSFSYAKPKPTPIPKHVITSDHDNANNSSLIIDILKSERLKQHNE